MPKLKRQSVSLVCYAEHVKYCAKELILMGFHVIIDTKLQPLSSSHTILYFHCRQYRLLLLGSCTGLLLSSSAQLSGNSCIMVPSAEICISKIVPRNNIIEFTFLDSDRVCGGGGNSSSGIYTPEQATNTRRRSTAGRDVSISAAARPAILVCLRW